MLFHAISFFSFKDLIKTKFPRINVQDILWHDWKNGLFTLRTNFHNSSNSWTVLRSWNRSRLTSSPTNFGLIRSGVKGPRLEELPMTWSSELKLLWTSLGSLINDVGQFSKKNYPLKPLALLFSIKVMFHALLSQNHLPPTHPHQDLYTVTGIKLPFQWKKLFED